MRTRATLFGAALVAATTLVVAPPASADPLCFGTDDTVVACVDPTGRRYVDDCVHLGPPPCQPVVVDGPEVYCLGGAIGSMVACIDV